MRVAFGCDHTGVVLKQELMAYLEDKDHTVADFGTLSEERCDSQVYGEAVANAVVQRDADCGILICGTGVGISLAANKVRGIRACVCSEPYTAKHSKQHNNSNILAFGARVVGAELAKMIVDAWLDAKFLGGRYQQRVDMITAIEDRQYGSKNPK
jgi:ribose 5-phosphate isomerase B